MRFVLALDICVKSAYALKVAEMALAITVVTGTTPLLTPALRIATFWMAVMKPLRLVDYSTVTVFEWSRDSIRQSSGAVDSNTSEQIGNDAQYVNFLFQFPSEFRAWSDKIYRLEGLVPNYLAPQRVMECLAYGSGRDQKKTVDT